MHDCPDCGQACDCDGEDTWFDWDSDESMECTCECADEDFDDIYEDDNDNEDIESDQEN